MPKIRYESKKLDDERMMMIDVVDGIVREYAAQGYDLTLRQIYYRVVAKDLFPADRTWRQLPGTNKWVRDPSGTTNAEPNYKWLGDVVADGRMMGLLDWSSIVDRTRNLMGSQYWEKPSELVEAAAKSYKTDKWENQSHYVEVWVEKQALEGVISRAARSLDLNYFCCRGYTSLSEMWSAGQRLLRQLEIGKEVHIVHLGDHDPSGVDMSRDIKSRLEMFARAHMVEARVQVLRVALNMPQIERLRPPPNPAKLTDSRARSYIEKFGEESWELDSLEPAEVSAIIERAVGQWRDEAKWEEAKKREERGRATLAAIHGQFEDVVRFLRGEVI